MSVLDHITRAGEFRQCLVITAELKLLESIWVVKDEKEIIGVFLDGFETGTGL